MTEVLRFPASHQGGIHARPSFGRKIKLPATIAIKRQLLTMMFEDEISAIPPGERFKESQSPALAMLRKLGFGFPAPLER